MTDMPKSAMNPIRRRYTERHTGDVQTEDSNDRHRNDAHGEQRIDQGSEIDPQQQRNQPERYRNDNSEPADCLLKVAEFAHPLQMGTSRQRNLLCDFSLRLRDRAAQVPVTHAEFDGRIALLLLAIDVGRTGNDIYCRNLAQRNFHGPFFARNGNRDIPNSLRTLTIAWGEFTMIGKCWSLLGT